MLGEYCFGCCCGDVVVREDGLGLYLSRSHCVEQRSWLQSGCLSEAIENRVNKFDDSNFEALNPHLEGPS